MENLRKFEKTNINNEIRELNMYIQKDRETIERFRHQSDEYYRNQIKKLSDKIDERTTNVLYLQKRLDDLELGLLDKELSTNNEKVIDDIKRKEESTKLKKKEKTILNKTQTEKSKNFYQNNVNSDKRQRFIKKGVDNGYKYFLRTISTIPAYMKKNLSNMPNNKGYIWKDIQLFGSLPREEGNNTVLFEKQKNGLLIIHEWDDKEYKVWHKKDRDRKVLKSTVAKKNLNSGYHNLVDFMK